MQNSLPRILICEDDESLQLALRYRLSRDGFEVLSAKNGDEALAIIRNRKVDILLLDIGLRTQNEGLEYLPRLRALDEELTICMLSGQSHFENVRLALTQGASDFVAKDSDPEAIFHRVRKVFEERQLKKTHSQQGFETKELQRRHRLVGSSASMESLRKTIEKLRPSKANILIFGETGTGKEVVARLLRPQLPSGVLAPFVAVDSSTIHSQTAESILFGHEKGAFTGADKAKKGIFEEATGGVVYFDEIANMSLEIQAKLLRVIQEKEVTRLGAARTIPLEFRVISATNRDLEGMTKLGLFKEDLLQRLNVIPISIPPLRERKGDILELIEYFNEQNGNRIQFNESALEALSAYDWPGNIRELSNVVAYLNAILDSDEVDISDLPPKIRDWRISKAGQVASAASPAVAIDSSGSFYDQVAEFEKSILTREYDRVQGKISQLAQEMGMDRSHLYTKLKMYGLHNTASRAKSEN